MTAASLDLGDDALRRGRLRYEALRRAVAGVLYLRHRLEAEARTRHSAVLEAAREELRARRRGDDGARLSWATRRARSQQAWQEALSDLRRARSEAEAAKLDLLAARDELRGLATRRVSARAAEQRAAVRAELAAGREELDRVSYELDRALALDELG